jgi:hypothetical protein
MTNDRTWEEPEAPDPVPRGGVAIDMASCEPALRDDLPACWSADARSIAGAFRFGDSVRPWNWLELGAADAEKLWALLAAFVVYFNRRYAERPDRRIPPCWAEHGPLVEELTTLVFARWQAFESVHGSVGGAQYWHHYSLPAFYQRLRDWLGDDLLACQQGRHRSREDPPLDLAASWSTRTETIAMLDVTYRDAPSRAPDNDETVRPRGVEVPFLDKPDDPKPLIRNRRATT